MASSGASPPELPTIDRSSSFVYLDAAALHSLIPHCTLIPHIRSTLPSVCSFIQSPPRQQFLLSTTTISANNNSLLLMPSWSSHPSLPYIGLKAVTSFPLNSSNHNIPGVHAAYLLFDSATGAPLATIDGTMLTLLRTSAVSALASLFLSRPTPNATLLMVGAGALSPHLVAAHLFVRPSIVKVLVWNRNSSKADSLASQLREKVENIVQIEAVDDLDEAITVADIISCATGSNTPLVKGKLLKPGVHLDLVGSFTPAMRECDDEAMTRGRVFVDSEFAMEEAGELVGALRHGVLQREGVGMLVDVVSGAKVGRTSDEEITVFKSVGTAVADIMAAQLAYQTYLQPKGLLEGFVPV